MIPEFMITIIDVPALKWHWQIYEKLNAGVTGTPLDDERPSSLKGADARARELAQARPDRTFGVAILTDQAYLAGHGLWEYRVMNGAVSRFVHEAIHKLQPSDRK